MMQFVTKTSPEFKKAFYAALADEKSVYGLAPDVVYKEFSAYGLDPKMMKIFLGSRAAGLDSQIEEIAIMLQKSKEEMFSSVNPSQPNKEEVFNIYNAKSKTEEEPQLTGEALRREILRGFYDDRAMEALGHKAAVLLSTVALFMNIEQQELLRVTRLKRVFEA